MKTRVNLLMAALAMATTVSAEDEPKLTVKPSGRILFDAAYIHPQHQEDKLNSGVGTPDPGNMELCLQYNYTSLSDSSAGLYGGYLNDWALCYNYYINKYRFGVYEVHGQKSLTVAALPTTK